MENNVIKTEDELLRKLLRNISLNDIEDLQIPESLIEKYIDDIIIKTDILYINDNLSKDFIKKHLDKIRLHDLPNYKNADEELFDYVIEKKSPYSKSGFYSNLSRRKGLSEHFIRKHVHNLNAADISYYQRLSETFIRDFKKWVSWKQICFMQTLSEDFIRKHENLVRWDRISTYQKLSISFVEEFKHKIDFNNLSTNNKSLTYELMLKYKNRLNWAIASQHFVINGDIPKELESYIDWKALSQYRIFTKEFLIKYKDKLDWFYLGLWQNFDLLISDELIEYTNWDKLLKFKSLSDEQLNILISKVNMSIETIKKYYPDFTQKEL